MRVGLVRRKGAVGLGRGACALWAARGGTPIAPDGGRRDLVCWAVLSLPPMRPKKNNRYNWTHK